MTRQSKQELENLVKRCLVKDEKAFIELYNMVSPILYTICLRYMGQPANAKDALQETFIRIFKGIPKFSFSGSFEGWCKRIAVNTSIELLRKDKSKFSADINDVHIGISPKSLENLKLADLLKLVNKLPVGYRTVFNLYVIEGYSHRDIGEKLGISENTSKSQLFKGRKTLQSLVNQYYN